MAPDSMETDEHEEEVSSTRTQQGEQHRQSFFVSGKLTPFDGSSGGMVLWACMHPQYCTGYLFSMCLLV